MQGDVWTWLSTYSRSRQPAFTTSLSLTNLVTLFLTLISSCPSRYGEWAGNPIRPDLEAQFVMESLPGTLVVTPQEGPDSRTWEGGCLPSKEAAGRVAFPAYLRFWGVWFKSECQTCFSRCVLESCVIVSTRALFMMATATTFSAQRKLSHCDSGSSSAQGHCC